MVLTWPCSYMLFSKHFSQSHFLREMEKQLGAYFPVFGSPFGQLVFLSQSYLSLWRNLPK